jgi:hypothetical protein
MSYQKRNSDSALRFADACRKFPANARTLTSQALIWAVVVVGLLSLSSARLHAQVDVATLRGTVTDPSGATVSGATVNIENTETSSIRSTVTNDAGEYNVPALKPGTYTVTVTKTGFSTDKHTALKLEVNDVASLNVTLQVGNVTQTIEVASADTSIETSTASLGSVMPEQQILDLPLNGRQFSQLLQLAPGVVPIDNSQNAGKAPNFGAGAASPGVDGQTNRSNIFFLDGIIASNPFFGGFSFSPSIDAIQEFKAQSHTDQAEFGQATGAIVSVVSRAGTNTFHGAVYWFIRNDAFDAKNAFDAEKLPYHLNQFGGSIGGPIIRNKLFFYANYEGGRQIISPSANFSTVPTDAERAGDFSGPLPGNVSPVIYDPSTFNPVTLTESPFPNNMIPGGRIDAGMLAYLNGVYPHANHAPNSSNENNYLADTKNTTNGDQGSIRVDYTIGSKDSLNGRYSQNEATLSSPSSLANLFVTGFDGKNTGATYVHAFNPTLVMEITGGYNNLNIPQGITVAADQAAVFAAAGLGAGFNTNPGDTPVVLIPGYGLQGGNYSGFWNGAGPIGPMHIVQAGGDVTKTYGTHNLKFGASFYRTWMYTNWNGNNMDFSNKGTWNSACQYASEGPTEQCPTYNPNAGDLGGGGDAVASMLLSAPIDATRNLGNSGVNLIENNPSVFAQDSWKVSPKLTLNYGIRWDFSSPMREKDNRLATYNTAAQEYSIVKGDVDLPSGPLPANTVVLNRNTIVTGHYDNFQPRFGFAYQVTPKTVLSGGVGNTYDDWGLPLQVGQQNRGAWPSGLAQNASSQPLNTAGTSYKPDETQVTGQNPFYGPAVLGASPLPAGGLGFQDIAWVPADSVQWNVQVQQDFGKVGIWSVAYVGSHTSHQTVLQPYNAAHASTTPFSSSETPDQIFVGVGTTLRSTGYSNYESFQTKLTRNFANGLTYNAAFTWSSSLGFSSCNGDFSNVCIQDLYNQAADYGPTDLNIPIIFTFNATYQLPFGKGKAYATTGVSAAIFGNWQINGIVALRSGQQINPTNGATNDNANVGGGGNGGNQRVNFVSNPETGAKKTKSSWFNPDAFELPANGTFGNAGINALRGPSYSDVDFSVFRDFPFTERATLQFRAESFDVFNHPNLGNPNGSFSGVHTNPDGSTSLNGSFNTITNTVPTTGPGANRLIQLGLKLIF